MDNPTMVQPNSSMTKVPFKIKPLFIVIISILALIILILVIRKFYSGGIYLTNNSVSLNKNLESSQSAGLYNFSGKVLDISGNSLTVETFMGQANKTPQEADPKLTDVTVLVSDQNLFHDIKKGQQVLVDVDLSKSQVSSNKFFAIRIHSISEAATLPLPASSSANVKP